MSRGRTAVHAEQRLRLFTGLFVLAFVLAFQEGAITVSDGLATYQVAQSLVERGSVAIDAELGVAGRGGAYYSRYGVGLSALAVAPYALAYPVAVLSGRKERVLQAAVASLMPLIAGLAAVAVYDLSRRLSALPVDSAVAGLGMVLGTFFLPYARDFFSEPLAALLLVVTIERLLARRYVAAAVALGLATLVRPQLSVLVPALAILVALKGTRRTVGYAAAALLGAAAVNVAYNLLRFGDPLELGYAGQGFTTPIEEGTAGLLLDPSKSVFLFAPVLLVAPAASYALLRRDRPAGLIVLGNLAVAFVLTATWWAWEGGWSWGPRLLIPGLLPLGAAIAVWMGGTPLRRRLMVALFAVGFVVSAPTLLVSTRAQQLDDPPPSVGPGITRQFELVPEVLSATAEETGSYEAGSGENYRFVNTWQIGLIREAGAPGGVAAALLTAILLGVAGFAGVRLSRLLREASAAEERELPATAPDEREAGRPAP